MGGGVYLGFCVICFVIVREIISQPFLENLEMTCHQNRQLPPPWLQNMDRIIAWPGSLWRWDGFFSTTTYHPPSQTLFFSLLKKSRYTLIKSVVDVWMYKPWNEHFSFVWNDKYKKSNSIANRVIPKKVFYRMLLNHQQRFLSKLSRIKSSQVTFMDKFGPRALNFG